MSIARGLTHVAEVVKKSRKSSPFVAASPLPSGLVAESQDERSVSGSFPSSTNPAFLAAAYHQECLRDSGDVDLMIGNHSALADVKGSLDSKVDFAKSSGFGLSVTVPLMQGNHLG